jgi:hypothetical protein
MKNDTVSATLEDHFEPTKKIDNNTRTITLTDFLLLLRY